MFSENPPTCWYQNQNHLPSVVLLADWSAVTIIGLKQVFFFWKAHVSPDLTVLCCLKKCCSPYKCRETIRFSFHLPLKQEHKSCEHCSFGKWEWTSEEELGKNIAFHLLDTASYTKLYTAGHGWANPQSLMWLWKKHGPILCERNTLSFQPPYLGL